MAKELRDEITPREKIRDLFSAVGANLESKGVASFELHELHDTHAFYRLTSDSDKVIHVQGYPGMSSEEKTRVWSRLFDYEKMMEIRTSGEVSIGNEHAASIQQFPKFESGVDIPYDSEILEGMLAENVPSLR